MHQEKIDRWAEENPYRGQMAEIQDRFQRDSLERLRTRLQAAGIGWYFGEADK